MRVSNRDPRKIPAHFRDTDACGARPRDVVFTNMTPRTSSPGIARCAATALGLVALACSAAKQPETPAESGSDASDAGADAPSPDAEAPGTITSGAFGADTPGGLGGAVLPVTTLDASGPGSLAEALATPGPRVIVFEVGGSVDLAMTRLDIVQPFVTVAGQTAPSPGITLIRGGMRVMTHDVVIQHVRFRMGDAGTTVPAGFEPDVTTDGAAAHDVLFDHVSVAWGVDENLSVSGPRFDGPEGTSRNVTIRNSIIAEGLRNSVHEKGAHSMGTLVHDYCTGVAVIRNLYAHNDERNPWFKGFANGAVVNNVVYNPGRWAMRLGAVPNEWTSSGITPEGPRVSIVGNYLKFGVDTPASQTMVGTNSAGAAYLEDNVALDAAGSAVPIASAAVTVLAEKPAWPANIEVLSALQAVDWVVAHAGARPRDRDAVDARIVSEFLAGGGTIRDSQEAVGGYPSAEPVERRLDVPDDVAPWLEALAAELE